MQQFGLSGGQVSPAPYPPNTIEQTVQLIPGATYEFRMDAIGYRNSTTGNSDIGTIWVTVEGVEIARHAFGSYVSPQRKRAEVCGRYVATIGGPAQLVIFFERRFLGGTANPRMNIDNVSLQEIAGPTFCVRGNRMLGTSIDFVVEGAPTAPYALYIATNTLAVGIPFAPLSGELWLDPSANFALFLTGNLGAAGVGTTTLPIPFIPALTVTPFSYQAIAALPPTFGFSLPTTLVMSQ